MRIKSIYVLLISLTTLAFYACDNDDEIQKTAPVVSIDPVKDVTANSVTVSGKIVDAGNDAITEAGFVYSSNVTLPTVADNKVIATVTDKVFSGTLASLTSGTTYHVRAFATNSVSTTYTDVLDFSTNNLAPTVSNITIEGTLEVNRTIEVKYAYSDSESDSEGETTFQWYVANNAAGEGEVVISGATAKSFLVQESQNGKYIRVSVYPKASKGTIAGTEVKSAYIGAVGEATTVTFTYNAQSVTYGIISRPSGKKWMDRNLGAERVAESIDDYKAFGDMFQWGRPIDGHQKITRTGGDPSNMSGDTGITEVNAYSDQDVPTTNKFIITTGNNGDWRNPQNDNLWQGATGINNPCPSGWRLATLDEWNAEGITGDASAFTELKLTHNGVRLSATGTLDNVNSVGHYWTSIPIAKYGGIWSVEMFFGPDYSTFRNTFTYRGNGAACRCIKD